MCPWLAKKAFLNTFQTNAKDSTSYCDEYFKGNKNRLQCELRNGELTAYEKEQPSYYIRSIIKSVEHRRGTSILILKCGPNGRLLTFLEFDSKKETDEWEEEICKFTGQKYNTPIGLRRVTTEIQKRRRMRFRRAQSALPDTLVESSDPALSSQSSSSDGEGADEKSDGTTPDDSGGITFNASSQPEHQVATCSRGEGMLDLERESYGQCDFPSGQVADGEDRLIIQQEPELGDHLDVTASNADVKSPVNEGYTHSDISGAHHGVVDHSIQCLSTSDDPANTVGSHEDGQASSAGQLDLPCQSSGDNDSSTWSSEISPPSSLRSRGAELSPTLEELNKGTIPTKKYETKDLQKLVLFDVQNKVCVESGGAGIGIPGGAYIMTTDDNGPTNARALAEHFRVTADSTVELKIGLGARCFASAEGNDLFIRIKGNKDIQLVMPDALQKVCGASCVMSNGQRSSLVVVQIDNESINPGVQEEELIKTLAAALEQGHVTVHLLPESLLRALRPADNTDVVVTAGANVGGTSRNESCRSGEGESADGEE